jgi:dipeptidyl aminopeptidase/acylaminoacyl peptidase
VSTVAPYGSWVSPISAAELAGGAHPVDGARFVGDEVWWSELRPAQSGRNAVRRYDGQGQAVDVLPAPWNARTRVHEYGGSAWTTTDAGVLVFAEFSDQRLYRLDAGSGEPVALSPVAAVASGMRFAEVTVVGDEVWAVREQHDTDGAITRDICAVPLDASAANDPARIRSIVAGSHFLAYPRLSPDGRRLAWIAWNHPQMPWDGTELRVADLDADGRCAAVQTLAGSTTESVLQPEWADADTLTFISDRSGWWNLYRLHLDPRAEVEALYPMAHEFGGPLWTLGSRWYLPLGDGRLAVTHTLGLDRLALLDTATGQLDNVELPGLSTIRLRAVKGDRVLAVSGGAQVATGLRLIDLGLGTVEAVRLSVDAMPEAGYLSAAEPMTFSGVGGRDVHALVYPPANQDFQAPAGERPPYIAFVHGGPTAHETPLADLVKAYFTSRGIGIVDVNYGGSTGYGREYRERLRGQWGIVDVQDTVSAVLGLADAGLADRDRLTIEGGSAGGWTVLSALTSTDVFACGVSYFGVAELLQFALDTHDFESRYLDGLIGALPEQQSLYVERAPLSHVGELSCPVLLLQGLDDPVVPPSQAEMFRDALLAKGITHAYRAYEGESHGFRKAETIIDARESELSFYGQVMGFDPPGIPKLELWTRAD